MINKGKRRVLGVMVLGLCIASAITFMTPSKVYANSIEDNVIDTPEGNSVSQDDVNGTPDSTNSEANSVSQDDQDVANWIKNQRGMTGEQLQVASETLSPVTNMFGYIVGGIVVLIFTGVFIITALDLLYITIPPIRNLLYKAGTDGTGAYTGGGMAGGYGMGGYGGMHGGMMGAGGASGGTQKPTQWISDEAVMCASLLGGSSQAQNPGMMGGQMQQQNVPMKSVLGTYFKKRIFFMILLAVSVIILTSSALLGTGVNLAKWGLKLIELVNGYIPS